MAGRELTPTLSVLLPVHNGERTLEAAIHSVLSQTRGDFEFVIVDDGSTDDTFSILERFAASDDRIRLVPSPHAGLVAALNLGLEACRAPLIARMDADDLCLPGRFEIQLPHLLSDPSLVLVDGRVDLFRDEGEVPEGMSLYAAWANGLVEPDDFDREILVESPLFHPAVIYRKDAVIAAGGYLDGPFPEDYELWLRLHAAGGKFRRVPETVLRMRDRPDRLTRTHPRYGKDAFRNARMRWLQSGPLSEPRRIALWGAGKESKPWLRFLLGAGHTIPLIVDVAARRIGGQRGDGIPVRAPESLIGADVDLALVAVGARGARDEIRGMIRELRPEWREGRDWWALR